MRAPYHDLHALASQALGADAAPVWFDENGTPRWCDFRPTACADIYADEAVLLLIECQNCGQSFRVADTHSAHDDYTVVAAGEGRPAAVIHHPRAIADAIKTGAPQWGDPPNAGCCAAGPTMTSETLRVLEYWRRTKGAWERDATLEVSFSDGWLTTTQKQQKAQSGSGSAAPVRPEDEGAS